MRYIVIEEDGQLYRRSAPSCNVALRDVGPEGWDMVRLGTPSLRGFVNDCGMIMPERYGRNVVGSVLLAACGATIYPYCGPVLLAGWIEPADCEIVSLTDPQVDDLRTLHRNIQLVLAGQAALAAGAPPRWAAAVREIAEAVQTRPLPTQTVTVMTVDEALAALNRGAR